MASITDCIRNTVYQFKNDMDYYNKMLALPLTSEEKDLYENLINSRTEALIYQIGNLNGVEQCENEDKDQVLEENSGNINKNVVPLEENQSEELITNNIINGEDSTYEEMQLSTQQIRQLSIDDLTYFNGKNGRKAYIAVDEIIYDVTNDLSWGAHKHSLTLGRDLSNFYRRKEKKEELYHLPIIGIVVRK
ncbi:cytochrome b5-like heme/steroid binding domain-containing protein [Anaeromicropila herbilytica]|uniref:Cytochrome b5 heme-binding domain-containing protein n=1 Tax=Anaeromicropila herbilytica TaxID=2785025 RepID=A0A7R7EMH8_9FIRM|nr:hypothetical protein [Anaeromicropila herbilytica]BCN31247.1 hypothetical protein bsdtb5_25420 [Anaeromicropila herbilytica]